VIKINKILKKMYVKTKNVLNLNCFFDTGVFAFDGLLYVMGGIHGIFNVDSVEIYNPDTNTWSIKTFSTSFSQIYGAVVVDSLRIF